MDGRQICRKDLGVLEDSTLRMSEQCILTAKVASSIPNCIGKSAARISREVVLPLSPGKATPEVLNPVLASQCKTDMEILERIE